MNTITTKEIKPGYKQTPVGIIPEDWELKKLKDITIKIGSGSTPRGGSKVYVENAIPFIRSQNVNHNVLDVSDNVCIDLKTHQEMKSTIVYPNDVLLNITGASIGRTCVVPHFIREANVNQHVCIIRLKSNNNVFIQSYLSSFEGQKAISRNQTGGNREGLNHKAVGNLQLPIPPLPEQEHIASCLTTWDKGIEKLSTLVEAKKQQKKGLMQGLFNGQLTVDDGQLIQAKKGEDFTEDWEAVRLGDIAETFSGGTPSRSNSDFYKGEIPWIKSGELNSEFIYKTEEKISSLGLKNSSAKKVKPNSILIAMYGATAGVVGVNKIEAAINQAILAVIPRDKINLYFLFQNLKMIMPKVTFSRVQGGQPNLSGRILRSISLKLPFVNTQTAIAQVLQTADKEIVLLEQKLKRMQLQKKGLMQVLLTGQKRLV